MAQSISILVDGIKTIGSHNGVSRVVFYTLSADGEAQQTVELLIPETSFAGIADVITRMGKPPAKPADQKPASAPSTPIGFTPGR